MNVFANLAELNQSFSNIENEYLKDYSNTIKNVEEILENIKNAWKGKDADNFSQKMTEFIVGMNSLKNHIADCNTYLSKYSGVMESLDNAAKLKNINIE